MRKDKMKEPPYELYLILKTKKPASMHGDTSQNKLNESANPNS